MGSEEKKYIITKAVSKQYFLDELEKDICNFDDGNYFMPSEWLPVFDEYFCDLVNELEAVSRIAQNEDAQEIGQAMIKRLEELDTDDPDFPSYEIDLINRAISD